MTDKAIDWRWPNFKPSEFACPTTGEVKMEPAFLDRLQALRNKIGKPLPVTSGYRSPKHEAAKGRSGNSAHVSGRAVDIACSHALAFDILSLAPSMGFTGIGVQQKGAGRFIHLDDLPDGTGQPRPTVWSY